MEEFGWNDLNPVSWVDPIVSVTSTFGNSIANIGTTAFSTVSGIATNQFNTAVGIGSDLVSGDVKGAFSTAVSGGMGNFKIVGSGMSEIGSALNDSVTGMTGVNIGGNVVNVGKGIMGSVGLSTTMREAALQKAYDGLVGKYNEINVQIMDAKNKMDQSFGELRGRQKELVGQIADKIKAVRDDGQKKKDEIQGKIDETQKYIDKLKTAIAEMK